MSRIIRRSIATIREWCMLDGALTWSWHGLDDMPDDYRDRAIAVIAEHLGRFAPTTFKQQSNC